MKSEMIRRAIGGIDEDIIEAADKQPVSKNNRTLWIRWGSVAAVTVFILSGLFFARERFAHENAAPQIKSEDGIKAEGREAVLEQEYRYSVDEGRFAAYVKGKVIEERKIASGIDRVTVTAGWFDGKGKRLTEEHANAMIFEIEGISADIAVAIRFLDPLEGVAGGEKYYVIINPSADASSVRDYVIAREEPNATEVPE